MTTTTTTTMKKNKKKDESERRYEVQRKWWSLKCCRLDRAVTKYCHSRPAMTFTMTMRIPRIPPIPVCNQWVFGIIVGEIHIQMHDSFDDDLSFAKCYMFRNPAHGTTQLVGRRSGLYRDVIDNRKKL
jgi:hypothetical protein